MIYNRRNEKEIKGNRINFIVYEFNYNIGSKKNKNPRGTIPLVSFKVTFIVSLKIRVE